MDSKLIIVEGIPGAGKTTKARKIKEDLMNQGKKVVLYEEGMSHPADMAWQAYLTQEEFDNFVEKCLSLWDNDQISKNELSNRIRKQARFENSHVILAYTKIEFPDDKYWSIIGDVACKELCDGRSSFETFKNIHLIRWSEFALKANSNEKITIFECAFLQNHIFELMGVYDKSDEEILSYMLDLINTVVNLNPHLIYIKPNNVEKIIRKVSEERRSPNPYMKDWIDEVVHWVENINYGKKYNLKGIDGFISFCKERMRIEEYVISKLNIPYTIISRD